MLGSMLFAFFEMGFITGLKGFVAATLGGLGSIAGAMLGGILFGLIETFSTVFLSSAYKDAIGMILLIAILLVLLSGLVGLWQRGNVAIAVVKSGIPRRSPIITRPSSSTIWYSRPASSRAISRWRSAGGAQERRLSVLRLGYRAADHDVLEI